MKILVVADDYQLFEGSFEYMNQKHYAGTLEICNKKISEASSMADVSAYDKVFAIIIDEENTEQFCDFIVNASSNVKRDITVITWDVYLKTKKLSKIELDNVRFIFMLVNFIDLYSDMQNDNKRKQVIANA